MKAIAIAVLVAAGYHAAAAELVPLPDTRTVLDVPAGWSKIDAPGLVAAYRKQPGLVLAVTRAQVPNPDAWRDKTREAYADQIERGIAAAIPKYRRLKRKLTDVHGVPALDLEARGEGVAVTIRVLLYRTYALSLAIEAPGENFLDEARAIVKGFAPPPPAPPR